jgi:hypothetical protein
MRTTGTISFEALIYHSTEYWLESINPADQPATVMLGGEKAIAKRD